MTKTNESEILKLINDLNNEKSAGHDEFSAKFLKLCAPYISVPLVTIFNRAISCGIYPDLLKIARVTPIHKKGNRHDPNNYRPISVLSMINKAFEKILHTRLYSYLTKFNIIYEYQFGFREGHSTTQALIEINDKIKSSIDNKLLTSGIFIDLTKAFDTVNHDILLDKMEMYGIRGNTHSLFKNYLTNRKQYVRVNNINSDMREITCGVPQGSVLGPLLFILYINDIANCCNEGYFRIFADDTGIFCHSNDITSLIQKSEIILKNVYEWFIHNKLTLNVSKTAFIIFRSKRYPESNLPDSITYNDIKINRVSQIKYLGLIFDEYMSWNAHVADLCNKLKCFFSIFYNIRNYVNKDHIRVIYYTMIYSRIKYGCIVYGLTSVDNLEKIQVMQNKLLKVISHKPYRFSTNKLHNELFLLKFEDIVKQEILSFVHDYVHSKLPSVFANYFQHRHSLADILSGLKPLRLIIPIHKTNIGANTVKVKGSKFFNDEASNISLNYSLKTFRYKIKKKILYYPEN